MLSILIYIMNSLKFRIIHNISYDLNLRRITYLELLQRLHHLVEGAEIPLHHPRLLTEKNQFLHRSPKFLLFHQTQLQIYFFAHIPYPDLLFPELLQG